MTNSKRFLPTLAAVGSVFLFSTGGVSIKTLEMTALPIAGMRGLIAAIFLWFYLRWQGRTKELLRMTTPGWIATACYVAMTTSYVVSMKATTAANAIFLQYTMPAWVLVGGALWLKERITLNRVLTVGLSIVGMLFFFIDELSPRQWWGNCVALFSGFTFAGLVLALRRDREHGPLEAVFWGNAINAVIVLPIAYILEPEFINQLRTFSAWIGILWLGIFQIGFAYILYIIALKGLPAIEVAILSLIEPVINPTWVFIVNGEVPSYFAVVGGAIILISVLIHNLTSHEVEEEAETASV